MVLADANTLLELLLPNRYRQQAVAAVLGSIERPAITTLTAHIVWYFGRKDGVSDKVIADLIAAYELLPLTSADYAWARANEEGKDFEDALQVAMALNNGCDQFITLDTKLVKRYQHLPIEFIIPGK